MIEDLQTSELTYWQGHATTHYHYSYGVDLGSDKIWDAEEWDVVYALGAVRDYGNPFGHHSVPVTEEYSAVKLSPNHGWSY